MSLRVERAYVDGSSEPVTGAELAASLRVTNPTDVALCTGYAEAARQLVEKWCSITIRPSILTVWADSFISRRSPGGDPWWDGVRDGSIGDVFSNVGRCMDLPLPPIYSGSVAITMYDDSDAATVVPTSSYYVDTTDPHRPIRISLRRGATWPAIVMRVMNGIKFVYQTGYATCPQDLKEAILMVGAKLFTDRGECDGDCVAKCGATPLLLTHRLLYPPC